MSGFARMGIKSLKIDNFKAVYLISCMTSTLFYHFFLSFKQIHYSLFKEFLIFTCEKLI